MSKLLSQAVMMSVAVTLGGNLATAQPLGTEFTYQGELRMSGTPLNDSADFEFTLWDAEVDGNMIGPAIVMDAVEVIDGLFAVELDYGAAALDGNPRWLQVAVRSPAGFGGFVTMDSRQPLTATPYSLQTRGLHVDDAGQIGAGTTTPFADLHIVGQTTRNNVFVESDSPDGTWLTMSNSSTLGRPWSIVSTGSLDLARSGFLVLRDNRDGDDDYVFGNGGLRISDSLNGLVHHVAAGPEALRIVRGSVTDAGTPFDGDGFTAVRLAAGRYGVTYDAPYPTGRRPTVTTTPVIPGQIVIMQIISFDHIGFIVAAFSPGGQPADTGFTFIAAGGR